MKKIYLFMIVFLSSLAAMGQKQIVMLHTNDTHSCILPLSENLADTVVAGRGGYLRRIEMVEKERQNDSQLLLLDSGDFSQGSPYYTLFKGDVEVELMNRMGYDAATIGNHEFDFGLENMARLFQMAKFPIVCCNYDFTGTPVEGLVKPYVVIKRKGVKIGIFGVCPAMKGLVDENKCEGVKFLDPVTSTQQTVETLRNKEKCDVVVCLSHLGWSNDPNKDDRLLISNTNDIDIVLGGHSHTYFEQLRYENNSKGLPTPDDQNGKHGVYVGKIVMTVAKK